MAGAAGSSGAGAGGIGGSGGEGGAAASAGVAGVGGSGGAADASLDAPDAGLVCAPIPAAEAGTGDAGAEAGVPDAAITQWRDWDANACAPCPARNVVCADLVGVDATFDAVTRQLRLVLAPGTAEVVSATVTVDWDGFAADGGFASGTASATLTVDRDVLTADLAGQVPDGVYALRSIQVEIDDACGARSTVGNFGYFNELLEGGTVINLHCEV